MVSGDSVSKECTMNKVMLVLVVFGMLVVSSSASAQVAYRTLPIYTYGYPAYMYSTMPVYMPPDVVYVAPSTTYQQPVMYRQPTIYVHPKVYIEGQPIRNFLRAITP
jgi:hypothetical protein